MYVPIYTIYINKCSLCTSVCTSCEAFVTLDPSRLYNSSMELTKSFITIIFLIFLIFSTPCMSTGRLDVAESEVYEIDYRGPETHSSVIPPPGHSHGRPFFNHQTTKTTSKPANNGDNVKKIHG